MRQRELREEQRHRQQDKRQKSNNRKAPVGVGTKDNSLRSTRFMGLIFAFGFAYACVIYPGEAIKDIFALDELPEWLRYIGVALFFLIGGPLFWGINKNIEAKARANPILNFETEGNSISAVFIRLPLAIFFGWGIFKIIDGLYSSSQTPDWIYFFGFIGFISSLLAIEHLIRKQKKKSQRSR
tara:strand:+ start:25615 stop:26163 length:549 start_codon:yes stop_codon:yes gene_type:complete